MRGPCIAFFTFGFSLAVFAAEVRATTTHYPLPGTYVRLSVDSTELRGDLIRSDSDELVVRLDGDQEPTVVSRRDVTSLEYRESNLGRTVRYGGVTALVVFALATMGGYLIPTDNGQEPSELTWAAPVMVPGFLLGALISWLTKGPDRWTSVPVYPSVGFDPARKEWGASVSLGF